MATDQQFCLRWNNHQSTLISVFDTLLENGTLVDCTLAAEGQYLKAHKVVLSACSPYLEALLSQHYEKHPIVILKDVKYTELKSMMDYMYRGEVNISQDQLGTFLKAAESLQIKGLSDNGDDARDVGSTAKRSDAPSSKPSVTPVRNNIESKRPAPPGDLSDASRDGSISPSALRKRRRTRRPSQGDDPDSHLDTTNNLCDNIPIQAQSTPLPVPSTTIVPTPVQNLPKQIVKQEPSISRIDTSLNSSIAPESGLLKEKIEPPSEPLLEPKTEYLDYMNNENSIEVEDLTLDDDDEDLDSSMDASRPGPSHGDMSNQGYPPWSMAGDQSGTDEIFMAAQEAVGAASAQQRDSQEGDSIVENGVEGAPRSASSLSRGRVSSCESFAGFSSCEKDKKDTNSPGKIIEKDSKSPSKNISQKKKAKAPVVTESPAVRVGKPRSSKSKASLVWKPVKPMEMAIKEEPIDDDYESPKKGVKKSVKIEEVINSNKKIKTESDEETSGKAKRVRKQKSFVDCESGDELLKGNVKSKQAMRSEIDSIASTSSTQFYDSETSEDQSTEPMQKRRSTKKEGFFKCNQCGKVYKYMRGMRQHQRLECNKEPQFPCPYCPSKFRYRQNIREHVRGSHEQAFPKWYATHYVVPLLMKENLS